MIDAYTIAVLILAFVVIGLLIREVIIAPAEGD